LGKSYTDLTIERKQAIVNIFKQIYASAFEHPSSAYFEGKNRS
jgi:hypothetical protein